MSGPASTILSATLLVLEPLPHAGSSAGGHTRIPEASLARVAPEGTASEPSPAVLYEQGRKAYRLGDFATAVEKWERAYELSDRPLFLYNISLAYKGLYGISKDIAHLRRARAVLDNFIKIAEADPDLEVDDAPERLAELDHLIAEAEAEAEAAAQRNPTHPSTETDPAPDTPRAPRGPDPGRTFRLAGIGTLAGGGVLLLAAGGLVTYYAVRGQDFSDRLRDDRAAREGMGCDARPSDACAQLDENIETWRRNGRKANRDGYISGAVTGGLGLVALVAGSILFTEGNRRSRHWERGLAVRDLELRWTGSGLAIAGRF